MVKVKETEILGEGYFFLYEGSEEVSQRQEWGREREKETLGVGTGTDNLDRGGEVGRQNKGIRSPQTYTQNGPPSSP